MKAVRFAATTGCVLLTAGCGPASGKQAASSPTPSASATRSATPADDKGPVCVGDPVARGIHVLRGGSVTLQGGAGTVLYREARSDGADRTAVLTNGTGSGTAQTGSRAWAVQRGQELTLHGVPFTVAQICTYRVVLAPAHGRKAVLPSRRPAPSAEATWPSLTDGRFRLRWHVPDNEYSGQYGAVVTEINPGPRADIGITGRDGGDAFYRDSRVGDTLEFGGRLWKVSAIETGDGSPAESNPDSGYVDLQLVGPAGG
ncbi:hypothetical protein [Streptomyces sp. NBC_00859]|uniref:hypothetical protein n=1 Tax=Streptomyces sp. NBC_00859 TaxID=2903682 RepID=UPI00386BECDD|nr:hypothetical protein OG584_14060 [Streptomyces sp. NBC_00859]